MIHLGAGRPATALPLLLADLHQSLPTGATIDCCLSPRADTHWNTARAVDLAIGAGFTVNKRPKCQKECVRLTLTRRHSLPDTVSNDMRLLIVGLNPSPYSADHGIAYARPGNRFWPAALAAGLVTVDRDPRHALQHHGLGMTDLVRRSTARADQVERTEFSGGFKRVERLAEWLQPAAACFIGLGAWRQVIDRRASAGIQTRTIGGRPVYLMPHTSGLNAHSRLNELAAHLGAAAVLADRSR